MFGDIPKLKPAVIKPIAKKVEGRKPSVFVQSIADNVEPVLVKPPTVTPIMQTVEGRAPSTTIAPIGIKEPHKVKIVPHAPDPNNPYHTAHVASPDPKRPVISSIGRGLPTKLVINPIVKTDVTPDGNAVIMKSVEPIYSSNLGSVPKITKPVEFSKTKSQGEIADSAYLPKMNPFAFFSKL